jgi:hypothetical protein
MPANPTATFQFPNLRSGPGITAVTVIDNDTAGVVVRESGTDTIVVKCGDATCSIPGDTDDYWLRLTKRPEDPNDLDHNPEVTVQVAILTDGLADVKSVNGSAIDYIAMTGPVKVIGGYVPSRMFLGNLTFANDGLGNRILVRANGSEAGSFIDEGFAVGQFIQLGGTGALGFDGQQYHIKKVTETTITLLENRDAVVGHDDAQQHDDQPPDPVRAGSTARSGSRSTARRSGAPRWPPRATGSRCWAPTAPT